MQTSRDRVYVQSSQEVSEKMLWIERSSDFGNVASDKAS